MQLLLIRQRQSLKALQPGAYEEVWLEPIQNPSLFKIHCYKTRQSCLKWGDFCLCSSITNSKMAHSILNNLSVCWIGGYFPEMTANFISILLLSGSVVRANIWQAGLGLDSRGLLL